MLLSTSVYRSTKIYVLTFCPGGNFPVQITPTQLTCSAPKTKEEGMGMETQEEGSNAMGKIDLIT